MSRTMDIKISLTRFSLSFSHTLTHTHTFNLPTNTEEEGEAAPSTLLACNVRAPSHMLLHVKTNTKKQTFISFTVSPKRGSQSHKSRNTVADMAGSIQIYNSETKRTT